MSNFNVEEMSIVHWLDDVDPHKCGYCKNTNCSVSNGMWAERLLCEDYQNLIDRGWRRSGKYLYKPIMDKTCCPQYTIRCNALNLKLSKSQKKVIKKFNKFLGDDILKKDIPPESMDDECGDPSQVYVPHNTSIDIDYKKVPDINFEIDSSDNQLCTNMEKEEGCSHSNKNDISQNTKDIDEIDCSGDPPLKQKQEGRSLPIKKGEGPDPLRPPCKKAKVIRLERKQQKLREQNMTVEKVNKNLEKSLEEFLNDLPQEIKHKLSIILVRTSKPNEQWKQVSNTEFELYKKYQMAVHNDTPSHVTMKNFSNFLVNSPLEIKCETMHPKHQYFQSIFSLYANYQMIIHNDDPSECDQESFINFLVSTPLKPEPIAGRTDVGFGSYHQQYWLDDKLIAVGVIDILPRCVSSVYFFYDPDYRSLTLGTYGSLREIEFVRTLSKNVPTLQYYYMGFYIHSCPKMRYKGKMNPSELVCPETYRWIPIETCIPKLDKIKYSRLCDDPKTSDEIGCSEAELNYLKVLKNYHFQRYSQYHKRSPDAQRFRLIGKLIGKQCLPSLLVVLTD